MLCLKIFVISLRNVQANFQRFDDIRHWRFPEPSTRWMALNNAVIQYIDSVFRKVYTARIEKRGVLLWPTEQHKTNSEIESRPTRMSTPFAPIGRYLNNIQIHSRWWSIAKIYTRSILDIMVCICVKRNIFVCVVHTHCASFHPGCLSVRSICRTFHDLYCLYCMAHLNVYRLEGWLDSCRNKNRRYVMLGFRDVRN